VELFVLMLFVLMLFGLTYSLVITRFTAKLSILRKHKNPEFYSSQPFYASAFLLFCQYLKKYFATKIPK
ncbi:MAG: hypothetical protein CR960_01795, partial [Pasteurellales bacterium]